MSTVFPFIPERDNVMAMAVCGAHGKAVVVQNFVAGTRESDWIVVGHRPRPPWLLNDTDFVEWSHDTGSTLAAVFARVQQRPLLSSRGIVVVVTGCENLNQRSLRKMCMNGRFYQLTVVICIETLHSIPPMIRANLDCLILTDSSQSDNTQTLQREHGIHWDGHLGTYSYMVMTSSPRQDCTGPCDVRWKPAYPPPTVVVGTSMVKKYMLPIVTASILTRRYVRQFLKRYYTPGNTGATLACARVLLMGSQQGNRLITAGEDM
jgi:hypothetical protein